MSDHSSPSRQGLAPSEDEDRSPDSRDPYNDELDQMDDDDTEDEGEDGVGKQEEKENTEPGADTMEDEHASDEEKTSDLFPPTPRSLSPCTPPPEEPQPLGLNRRFGMSSFDDYDVITVHGIRDDRNTAWKSKNDGLWIRDNLFPELDIRQLDY